MSSKAKRVRIVLTQTINFPCVDLTLAGILNIRATLIELLWLTSCIADHGWKRDNEKSGLSTEVMLLLQAEFDRDVLWTAPHSNVQYIVLQGVTVTFSVQNIGSKRPQIVDFSSEIQPMLEQMLRNAANHE